MICIILFFLFEQILNILRIIELLYTFCMTPFTRLLCTLHHYDFMTYHANNSYLIFHWFSLYFQNSEEQMMTLCTGKPLRSTANAQIRRDQQLICQRFITMHRLAEIASYPGNPPAYASISVFDGMFSSVSNRSWFCSAHNIVSSHPPGPRDLGLASACTQWPPCLLPRP